jgi:hypothetical protein
MRPRYKYQTQALPISALASRYKALQSDPILRHFVMCKEASGYTNRQISVKCGVSTSCLRSWELGLTRRPQHITLDFVFKAMGYRLPPPERVR